MGCLNCFRLVHADSLISHCDAYLESFMMSIFAETIKKLQIQPASRRITPLYPAPSPPSV